MKKKTVLFSFVIIFFATLLIVMTGIVHTASSIKKGHRLYDENGNVNGCQSPGTDCEFTVSIIDPT